MISFPFSRHSGLELVDFFPTQHIDDGMWQARELRIAVDIFALFLAPLQEPSDYADVLMHRVPGKRSPTFTWVLE